MWLFKVYKEALSIAINTQEWSVPFRIKYFFLYIYNCHKIRAKLIISIIRLKHQEYKYRNSPPLTDEDREELRKITDDILAEIKAEEMQTKS